MGASARPESRASRALDIGQNHARRPPPDPASAQLEVAPLRRTSAEAVTKILTSASGQRRSRCPARRERPLAPALRKLADRREAPPRRPDLGHDRGRISRRSTPQGVIIERLGIEPVGRRDGRPDVVEPEPHPRRIARHRPSRAPRVEAVIAVRSATFLASVPLPEAAGPSMAMIMTWSPCRSCARAAPRTSPQALP